MRKIILVTGATRSGKSEWAERLAEKMDKPVSYIATALRDSQDSAWEARINQHYLRRPAHWHTLEIPVELASTIEQAVPPQCLLVDALGTWVSNCLEQNEENWQETVKGLLVSLEKCQVDVILVGEEVGWGVVPAYPLGRLFRDRLGSLIRQIGARSDIVYLVAGGYVLNLTELGQPLDQ